MKNKYLHTCELKRYRQITPQLCAVCPRLMKCKAFHFYYMQNKQLYTDFVIDICNKFPEKYILEVQFMAEKQSFVQVVDNTTGKIERIVDLNEIDALSAEEKLALARNKSLFIVTHRLEPIVKVEMKKTIIQSPIEFNNEVKEAQQEIKLEAEPEKPAPVKENKRGKKQ